MRAAIVIPLNIRAAWAKTIDIVPYRVAKATAFGFGRCQRKLGPLCRRSNAPIVPPIRASKECIELKNAKI